MTNSRGEGGKRGWGGTFEVLRPANVLKAKVGSGPAILDDVTAQRIEQGIASQTGRYLKILDAELRDLEDLVGRSHDRHDLDETGNRAIFCITHRIRGEAGQNDLLLIAAIANLLCEFLDQPVMLSTAPVEFVKLHVDAMVAVRAERLTGAGGERGKALLEGFRKARAKYLA